MSNKIPIDEHALRDAINHKKLTLAEISTGLGWHNSTLNKQLRDGAISKPMMEGLEHKYGIAYDQYKPKPEEPQAMLQVQDDVVDKLEEILDVLNVIAERLGVLITNG